MRNFTYSNPVKIIFGKNTIPALAVGGGSVIDATKFIALASQAEGDLWKIVTKYKYPDKAMPFGTILTLPATGSEMNCNAVITKAETHDKKS